MPPTDDLPRPGGPLLVGGAATGPVPREVLVAEAGPGAVVHVSPHRADEQYLVGPHGVVVALPAHDLAGASGVWSATRVRLHGPLPAAVATAVDTQVPVRGFVAVPGAGDPSWLPLGPLRPCMWQYDRDRVMTFCELEIDDPLAPGALAVVRPAAAPDLVVDPGAWLGCAAADPVRALVRFAADWYRALPVTDGVVRHGAGGPGPDPRVPWALREVHRLAVTEPRLLGTQNRLLPAATLDPDAPELVFGEENQGGFVWGVDRADVLRCAGAPELRDHLPVWRDDGGTRVPEGPLGRFLLDFTLFEAVMAAPYDAWASDVDDDALRRIVMPWSPVPGIGDGPQAHRRIYVGPDVVAVVDRTPGAPGTGAMVVVGARHRAPLARLAGIACDWDTFGG